MIVRILLLLLGILHIVNGSLHADRAAEWSRRSGRDGDRTVQSAFHPRYRDGVSLPAAPGCCSAHGATHMLRSLPVAGAIWPALHGAHSYRWLADAWISRRNPNAASEAEGVVGFAVLGVMLAWLRVKETRHDPIPAAQISVRVRAPLRLRRKPICTSLRTSSPRRSGVLRLCRLKLSRRAMRRATRCKRRHWRRAGRGLRALRPDRIRSRVEAGMSADTIKALLSGEPPVKTRNWDSIMRRALLEWKREPRRPAQHSRARWGRRGLIALSFMAMAARNSRAQRALGHAKTASVCALAAATSRFQQSLKAA